MNYRDAVLQEMKTMGTAGTWVFDINVKDIISRINIQSESVKSKNDMDDVLAADLVKIEIVDGSELLYSLSGKECQAVTYYDTGRLPQDKLWAQAAGTAYGLFQLDFGRHLFDTELAFDPTKFRNPQMRIQHNYRLSDTAATSLKLKVRAQCFDEKVPSPIGFLLNKEIYEYNLGASGSTEPVDIPTDYKLRQLFVKATGKGYCPYSVIGEMKLTEDNDKRIPFDVDTIQYQQREKHRMPPINMWMHTTFDVGTTYRYVAPSDLFTLLNSKIGGIGTGYQTGYSRGTKFGWVQAAAGQECDCRAIGHLPHHMVCFPFGDLKDMDDWYDVTKLGSLVLKLKAGGLGSAYTTAVVTQQLRPY